MKRTPLRRTRMKPWIRRDDDKVDPALRDYVLDRDQRCFAAKIESDHVCRDRFGKEHASDDRRRLTLDHVKDHARMGVRADSDKYHLVAVCGWANNEGWCSAHRQDERDYLADKEPHG